MQKAEVILSLLSQKSKNDEQYVFRRLYRNLFNPDFYLNAYVKIYDKAGNLTAGVDGKTIDGFNTAMVEEIIEKMKTETYHPRPVRRTYIPKKDGSKRPLGIPAFEDKLVQEVVRQILEAIYEPLFLDTSHGFRPNRSCHTALNAIKTNCRGTNWVIEGDIKGFFDNIDHQVLIDLLKRKIDDGRFIELIRRFLNAGYMEFRQRHFSYSGTPQGGIISPILANIYLHELDQFMNHLMLTYNKGNVRRRNPEYTKLNNLRRMSLLKGDKEQARKLLHQMRIIRTIDPMDTDYIRVKYVRYADDFVVCIIGPKELAVKIRSQIGDFLKNHLNLELNMEKTLITNLTDNRVRFLGYEIAKSRCDSQLTKNKNGVKKRAANDTIQLLVPNSVIQEKIKPFCKNGKAVHHNARINLPLLDMLTQYNAEIRGLYNYYCLATDVSTKIGKFRYYHYLSLLKTVARKEKTSVKKVLDRYGVYVDTKQGEGTRRVFGVKYQTKDGKEKIVTYFNDPLKKRDKPITNVVDHLPIYTIPARSQIIDRLNKGSCELCGYESPNTSEFEVHHVRKLKDIKRKYAKRGKQIPQWVLAMSRLNRKTLIVCKKCHSDIHSGRINKNLGDKA